MNVTPNQIRLSHRLAGGLQLLLLATLLWLRVDAHAHAQLHEGQHQAETQCAVTWLAQGQFSFVAPVVVTTDCPPEIFLLPALLVAGPVARAAHTLPFSCGPPQV